MKVTIRNLQKKIPISPVMAEKAVLKALSRKRSNKPGQITVCFIDDKRIRKLNLVYLGKDEPTDVIAFDISESRKDIIADIAVSADSAIRNARVFKTSALYELYLYIVHGVLHIAGYKDHNEKQRRIMQRKATDILSTLHITP